MLLNKTLENKIKKEAKTLTKVDKKLHSKTHLYRGSKDELSLYIDYSRCFCDWRGFVEALELTKTKKEIVDQCVKRIENVYSSSNDGIEIARGVLQSELNNYRGYDNDNTTRIFRMVLKAYDKFIHKTKTTKES